MAHDLAKPSAQAAGLLSTSSFIGKDAADTFTLRLRRGRMGFRTIVKDMIGDGDTTPQPEHNNILTGRHVLFGWMLAGQVLGLASISSSTLNVPTSLKIHLGSTEFIEHKVVVEAMEVEFDKVSPFVGVSMIVHLADDTVEES